MNEDLVELDADDLLLLITNKEKKKEMERNLCLFTSLVFSFKCCFNV
jgi:hypothetical protein